MKKRYLYSTVLWLLAGTTWCFAQSNNEMDRITIRASMAGGTVYMLDCENGFGGGNGGAQSTEQYLAMLYKLLSN
jgi:hypothetical protein